jgi:hypothetical protein
METVCVKVRLRPGSLPRVEAWAAELNARRDEVLATLRDEGVVVESVFLDGEALVYLKAKDVGQALAWHRYAEPGTMTRRQSSHTCGGTSPSRMPR